ncbi:conserved hypothetical protein [Desulfosarcina cetonica]|nr:conserved hypothetical protein [Desulfosarcina cetonica]
MPKLAYYLASTDNPIGSDHPLWRSALPEGRLTGKSRPSASAITYEDYFGAVAAFCLSNHAARLRQAATACLERPVDGEALGDISIFLEKHGAFYHPARLCVSVSGQTLSFVVNVAVSAQGQKALPREVQALGWLNEQRPFGWVPEVYAAGTIRLTDGRCLSMFLGSWFEGYHEFHLTQSAAVDASMTTVIWDGASEPNRLSDHQAGQLYQNAAMILTACYDPVTSRHIFPWHHAAGDFVVRPDGDRVSVRLITVRDTVPLVDLSEETLSEVAMLEALVLFFLHLSLRMRLDRLDGVGKVVWAPDACMAPMVAGFFQGLDLTAQMSGFPETFPSFFRGYFNNFSTSDLLRTSRQLTETTYFSASEERQVIDRHLDAHVTLLRRLMVDSG